MRYLKNRLRMTKDYLSKKNRLDSYPVEFILETTNNCNLRCTMCPINHMTRQTGYMELPKFRKIIDEIAPYAELVYLHGLGEPLLHPDIIEMVRYCRSRRVKTGISTNAMMLTEEMSAKLLEAGLDYIFLAFDGATKETFERVRKNADFSRVDKAVRGFLAMKDKIKNSNFTVVQMIVTPETEHEKELFLERWKDVKNINAIRIKREFDLRFLNRTPKPEGICDKPCFYLWRQANIYWDGTVSLCCMASNNEQLLGNIFDYGGFGKVWRSEKMRQARDLHIKGKWREIPICRKCAMPQPSYLTVAGLAALDTYRMRKILPFIEKMKIFGDFRDNAGTHGAKKRLEDGLHFLRRISPALFEFADKAFNIPRYIDMKNLKLLMPEPAGKVLEIGCGKGYFAKHLIGAGHAYYGLDIDRTELSFITKKKTRIIHGSGTEIPCKDNTFDIIFCNCVIEHVPKDDDLLREAARVLKKGGSMIFTFPTKAYSPSFIKRTLFKNKRLRFLADPEYSGYFDHADIQAAEDWYTVKRWSHVRRGYDIKDLEQRFASLGLEITSSFYFFSGPLFEIWDIFTFTLLNKLFPFSLILAAPVMRLMGVTRRGNEKNSFLLAVKATAK